MKMQTAIIDAIVEELEKAKAKFPQWPVDPIHASAVVQEEAGELVKACLQICYEPHKKVNHSDLVMEATQTAAMAIRFLENLHTYDIQPGKQSGGKP